MIPCLPEATFLSAFPGARWVLARLASLGLSRRGPVSKVPAADLRGADGAAPCRFSEDRVIEHYKKLNGQTRGQAIVK